MAVSHGIQQLICRSFRKVRMIERPKEYWDEQKEYKAKLKQLRTDCKHDSDIEQQKRKEEFITK